MHVSALCLACAVVPCNGLTCACDAIGAFASVNESCSACTLCTPNMHATWTHNMYQGALLHRASCTTPTYRVTGTDTLQLLIADDGIDGLEREACHKRSSLQGQDGQKRDCESILLTRHAQTQKTWDPHQACIRNRPASHLTYSCCIAL